MWSDYVAKTLCGPLHTKQAIKAYQDGLKKVVEQGGKIIYGNKVLDRPGNYVVPTITSISPDAPIVQNEIFVPILHTSTFKDLDVAIAKNNQVKQGLSSSLFTKDISNLFKWIGYLVYLFFSADLVAREDLIVGLLIAISRRMGLRLEEPLEVRRRLGAVANQAQIRGSSTCEDKRVRLIMEESCHWHRVSSLSS
jgi:hypothetical protein